jgi:hypothetical protein
MKFIDIIKESEYTPNNHEELLAQKKAIAIFKMLRTGTITWELFKYSFDIKYEILNNHDIDFRGNDQLADLGTRLTDTSHASTPQVKPLIHVEQPHIKLYIKDDWLVNAMIYYQDNKTSGLQGLKNTFCALIAKRFSRHGVIFTYDSLYPNIDYVYTNKTSEEKTKL